MGNLDWGRWAGVIALGLGLAACANENAETAPPPDEGRIVQPALLESTLTELVEDGRAAGLVMLVYEKGDEVYFGAHGMVDEDQPAARDTIFQIFSMTKATTGVALMTLYEDGLFELDAPIADYVPELANLKLYAGMNEDGTMLLVEPENQPTVRDVLRHTAGFANGGVEGSPVAEYLSEVDPTNVDNTLKELVTKLATVPLAYEPGTQWLYSPAVDVQAYMVERLSGQPYADYLQANVLDPLGMTDTAYTVPEDKRHRLAAWYTAYNDGELERGADERYRQMPVTQTALTPGSWGLSSTADDYMRFTRMLLNKGELDGVRILEPETVELMATNTLSDEVTERFWLPSKGQVGFGIDFAVRTAEPKSDDEYYGVVGEFFWDGWGTSMFWVDPASDIAAVFLVQKEPFDNQMQKDVRDAVYNVTYRGAAAE